MVEVSLDQSYNQFDNHNNEEKKPLFFTTEHFKEYFDNCNIFSQLKITEKLSPMEEKTPTYL